MKKAIIKYDRTLTRINHQDFSGETRGFIALEGPTMEISDGYHTMDELYEHRINLYIALCKRMNKDYEDDLDGVGHVLKVWRSRLHSDHTMFDNQFILGISKRPGEQISYHLPINRWQDTEFAETLAEAPKWDAHTPADVLNRLKNL